MSPIAARHHVAVIRAVVLGDEEAASAASDRLMDYVDRADPRDGQCSRSERSKQLRGCTDFSLTAHTAELEYMSNIFKEGHFP